MFNKNFVYFQGPEAGEMSAAETLAIAEMSKAKNAIEASIDDGESADVAVESAKETINNIRDNVSNKFSQDQDVKAYERAYRITFASTMQENAKKAISEIDANLQKYKEQEESINIGVAADLQYLDLFEQLNKIKPGLTDEKLYSVPADFQSQNDVSLLNDNLEVMSGFIDKLNNYQASYQELIDNINGMPSQRIKDGYDKTITNAKNQVKYCAEQQKKVVGAYNSTLAAANRGIENNIKTATDKVEELRQASGKLQQQLNNTSNPSAELKASAGNAFKAFTDQQELVKSLQTAQVDFGSKPRMRVETDVPPVGSDQIS